MRIGRGPWVQPAAVVRPRATCYAASVIVVRRIRLRTKKPVIRIGHVRFVPAEDRKPVAPVRSEGASVGPSNASTAPGERRWGRA
jgi:hypothetical protein